MMSEPMVIDAPEPPVIVPLRSKHYGTKVRFNGVEVHIWGMDGDKTPSARQLEGICTPDEWRNDRSLYEVCDSHYETLADYNAAKEFVALLNAGTVSVDRHYDS